MGISDSLKKANAMRLQALMLNKIRKCQQCYGKIQQMALQKATGRRTVTMDHVEKELTKKLCPECRKHAEYYTRETARVLGVKIKEDEKDAQ